MRTLLQARYLLRCVAIALVLAAEWLSIRVPTVNAEAFEEHAVELERTPAWRYGYVVQRHGAVLVKTSLDAGAPPLAPAGADDEIARMMARTLRLMPWQAGFELTFYASLWALWRVGMARWRRRFSSELSSPWRRSVAFGLLWAVLISAVLTPYLVTGYGEPRFSTWRGPGALSYTAWLGSAGEPWSPPLTYRAVVLVVLLIPLVSLELTVRFVPTGLPASFWLVSVVFYGVSAAAWAWVKPSRPAGRTG